MLVGDVFFWINLTLVRTRESTWLSTCLTNVRHVCLSEQVKVWFQNRRTKHKRMQQEEEAKAQQQQSGGGGQKNSHHVNKWKQETQNSGSDSEMHHYGGGGGGGEGSPLSPGQHREDGTLHYDGYSSEADSEV